MKAIELFPAPHEPRLVTFDVMSDDPDFYFVLTTALRDYAGRVEADPSYAPEQSRRWVNAAEVALQRIEDALDRAGQPAGDARWQALKDHLRRQVEQDIAVAESFRHSGDAGAAAAHYALVSANRSALAKMRELEAGQ